MKDIVLQEDVIIDSQQYKVTQYADGTSSIKRFNDKHKMWVNLNFTDNKNLELDKYIQDNLTQIFLNNKRMSRC